MIRAALLRSLALVAAIAAGGPGGGAARAEDEAPLLAGFGRRSLVTERRDVSLGGYGGRGLLPALGVHDPCEVSAMVLRSGERDGGRALAIVAADLIGVQRTIHDALARRPFPPEAGLAAEDVLVAASHTHAGYGSLAKPTGAVLLDSLFLLTCGPYRPDFFDEVAGQVHGAISDACRDLRPARFGAGARDVPGLARNRGRSGGAVDPELGVLKVVDARSGAVRGLVVSFAAHPVCLGAGNFELSAEYPGAMRRALAERFPGAVALFLQGAGGDQSPTTPPGTADGGFAKLEAVGRRLAGHAADLAAATETAPALAIRSRLVEVDLPRPPAAPESDPARERDRLRRRGGAIARSLFHQAVLGDTLLMGVPGEPCAAIGLDLKAAARARGFRRAFVVGLCQDHLGYFVHASDYPPGEDPERPVSHAYEKRLNFYGPEVGAFFREVHFDRLDPRPLAPPPPARPLAPAPSIR